MIKYFETNKRNYWANSRLFEFCLKHSSSIILSHIHEGSVTTSELEEAVADAYVRMDQMEQEWLDGIDENNHGYKKSGFNSADAYRAHVKKHFEENRRTIDKYSQCNAITEHSTMPDIEGYKLISRKLSIGNDSTFPGLYDLYEFKIDYNLMNIFESDIFRYPLEINGITFEDTVFINGKGNKWLVICSHEETGAIDAENNIVDRFVELSHGIKFLNT